MLSTEPPLRPYGKLIVALLLSSRIAPTPVLIATVERETLLPENVPADVIRNARKGTVSCRKAGYRIAAP